MNSVYLFSGLHKYKSSTKYSVSLSFSQFLDAVTLLTLDVPHEYLVQFQRQRLMKCKQGQIFQGRDPPLLRDLFYCFYSYLQAFGNPNITGEETPTTDADHTSVIHYSRVKMNRLSFAGAQSGTTE